MMSGGMMFLLLGLLHASLTIVDLSRPRLLTPENERLRTLMELAPLRLHPDLRLWDAWMGFNLSHSLGLVVFGTVVIAVAIFGDQSARWAWVYPLAAAAVGLIYVLMCLRFWFWVPAAGTATATALLVLASITTSQV
jgi:hypothetical protein